MNTKKEKTFLCFSEIPSSCFSKFNRPNYGILSGSLFPVYEQNLVTYSISSCVLFIDGKYRIKEKSKY